MAPELLRMNHPTILDEARDIRDELMDIQLSVAQAAHTELEAHLGDVRRRLGYSDPEELDQTGLVDSRIVEKTPVISPELLAAAVPLTARSAETTRSARLQTGEILTGNDDRLLVIAGPCSIHDPEQALEYAELLSEQAERVSGELQVIMRTYFEKPRSTVGWKGFAYDPELDGSHDINLGLVASRILMAQITHNGMPTATERLNTLTPQYLNGLVAYDAIGARNTTDQKQREYASGTSSPVGFKNTPEGSIVAAAEAVLAANAQHTFLGLHPNGTMMEVTTTGNPLAHIILRGDSSGPNYAPEYVLKAVGILRKMGLLEAVVIDASHGNSGKDHRRQIEVVDSVAEQVARGERGIKGVMIESNLRAGKQAHDVSNPQPLEYGVSITDACVDIDETGVMLDKLAESVRERRKAA